MKKYQKEFIQIIAPVILALVVLAGIGYWADKNGQIKINPSQKQIKVAYSPSASKRCIQAAERGLKQILNGDVSRYITSTDTLPNWLVYKDLDLEFQISFPKTWNVKRIAFTPLELVISCDKNLNGAKGDYYFDGPEGWVHISVRYIKYLLHGCP